MMHEGPGHEDVRKTEERSPTRAQPNYQQNSADEIREKSDEE
jgi:hypothetical protein